ncbi:MAG: helix-turn-helix transcriptional regulator [Myxococcota bacterium]
MQRQARLLAITEYLRARKTGVTAQQLAERFGVTLRTIYRDLDTLRDAELPVLAEQGRGGGYALDKHYTLPPVNLTPREAAVLCALSTHALDMRLVPFPEALGRALDKIRGALSASAQRELLDHLKQLHFVGIPAHAAPRPVIAAIEEAWFTGKRLTLEYESSNGERTTRTVRLEGLVMERTLTFLNCFDEGVAEKRQFRLDRVHRATVA